MADGTLKVGTITTSSGSGTITIGQSGETVSFPTGVNLSGNGITNTPAFLATLTSLQSISQNVWTKIEFNTKEFDTDNAFDNSTNYRFTVPTGKGGKYFFSFVVTMNNQYTRVITRLYKNGSVYFRGSTVDNDAGTMATPFLIDLDAGDYIEAYVNQNYVGGQSISGSSSINQSYFNGFKLLGV